MGKVKENYKISGTVKKVRLSFLNQLKLQNLNFSFDIEKNIYSLKQIDMKLNNIKITSPLIEIEKKKNSFFVNGQFLNDKKNFDIDRLEPIFKDLLNIIDIRKIEFSSKSKFSFNVNKKLKFDNFKVESIINLNQLTINQKNLKIKS